MKRILALTLSMVMMLGLASCGNGSSGTNSSNAGNGGSSSGSGDPAGETYDLVWAGTNSSSGYYALNVAVCDCLLYTSAPGFGTGGGAKGEGAV